VLETVFSTAEELHQIPGKQNISDIDIDDEISTSENEEAPVSPFLLTLTRPETWHADCLDQWSGGNTL
jgi:hypothetical protein